MSHLFLSAGDPSGDHHAARLLTHLHDLSPDLTVEGLGGPAMQAAGCELHEDLASQSIVGFGAAFRALPAMLGLLRRVGGILDSRRPDAVVLVDYPGFNLLLASMARSRGIPVVYYVAPQFWAWATWRLRRFARLVDEALVILPFEKPLFQDMGVKTHYIGHPLEDGLDQKSAVSPAITDQPLPVALLPGSRGREVTEHTPWLLETAQILAQSHPDITFHTAHVDAKRLQAITDMASQAGVALQTHGDDVHGVMASCHCALVASGTATLETALLGTPLVIYYKVTAFEQLIRRTLLVPPWVGLVNIAAGKQICEEVIITKPDAQRLAKACEPLLDQGEAYQEQKTALSKLGREKEAPEASLQAAEHVVARLASTD